jgi:SAM-dependent methyltransferase
VALAMSDPAYASEQRLAFGRVAELYDRARPSYPPASIDAVIAFGDLRPPARILEVGAGTGKATALLAQRGFEILALEPSPAMARVARVNCADHPRVQIVESEFERWAPEAPHAALISAAAWHWIDPDVRYRRAHAALEPGGTLAALWTFPDWQRCDLRDALRDAYRAAAPTLTTEFPMHPGSLPTRLAGDWRAEIAAAGRFRDVAVETFPWSLGYSATGYADLLQTHQDHILLADEPRRALLEAVQATIEAAGGSLTLPVATHVCLARRACD